MDLRNQADLVDVVEAIFLAVSRGFNVRPLPSRSTMRPLTDPGREFSRSELENVDLNRLYDALYAVAEEFAQRDGDGVRASFSRARLQRALAASKCHYLWFC